MLTVSCVLTGDKYTEEDVYRLKRNVEENITLPHRFVCLSDRWVPGVENILLEPNDWGVWNKMFLFKHLRDTLYFDLDVTIQHNIDSLVRTELTMIKCFWKPMWEDDTQYGRHNTLLNSSVMSWKGDLSKIFDKFIKDPDYHMVKYPGTDRFMAHNFFVRTYPKGTAFSRAHGIELGVEPNDGNTHFVQPEALVCLYNGKGKDKMREDFE